MLGYTGTNKNNYTNNSPSPPSSPFTMFSDFLSSLQHQREGSRHPLPHHVLDHHHHHHLSTDDSRPPSYDDDKPERYESATQPMLARTLSGKLLSLPLTTTVGSGGAPGGGGGNGSTISSPGSPIACIKRLRRSSCLRLAAALFLVCFGTYAVLLSAASRRRQHTYPTEEYPHAQLPTRYRPVGADNDFGTFEDWDVDIPEVVDSHPHKKPVQQVDPALNRKKKVSSPPVVNGNKHHADVESLPRKPAAKIPWKDTTANKPIIDKNKVQTPLQDETEEGEVIKEDPTRRPKSGVRPGDPLPDDPTTGNNNKDSLDYYRKQWELLRSKQQETIEKAVQQDRERREKEQKQRFETEVLHRIAMEREKIIKEYEAKLKAEQDSKATNHHEEMASVFEATDASRVDSRIFHPDLAGHLKSTKEAILNGFKWCDMLQGSAFNTWVNITPLGGSLITANPTRSLAAKMIDALARKVYDNLMLWAGSDALDPMSVRRFACYMSAHGKNEYALATDAMWMTHVDGRQFFPDLSLWGPDDVDKQRAASLAEAAASTDSKEAQDLNAANEEKEEADLKLEQDLQVWNPVSAGRRKDLHSKKHVRDTMSPRNKLLKFNTTTTPTAAPLPRRRRYKIAYLLLLHERLDTFSKLFEALFDQDGVFLIHVDAKRGPFRSEIQAWLTGHPVYSQASNIFVMEKSFNINWGASSIVFGQMEGFFTLMDLAEWDYVVNLSGYDYPVRSSKAIHTILERNPGKVYIEHWQDAEIEWRLERPFFLAREQDRIQTPSTAPERRFPLDHRFRPSKHHQWMILPREFVGYLRRSPDAHDLLAWAEHTWIPDESYFGMVALAKSSSEGGWADRVIADSKRYIYFEPGALHPIWLRNGDESKLMPGAGVEAALPRNNTVKSLNLQQREYFFVRKINSFWERDLTAWMDSKRFEVDQALAEEIETVDKAFWERGVVSDQDDYSIY
ncbi:core-2/I-branching enzyme-domain-containing protein [Phlyctochytrium arcticum]|nr:core-2/I-branching enzyme-domain-containing protein [Phlyctochytrium arcticum]